MKYEGTVNTADSTADLATIHGAFKTIEEFAADGVIEIIGNAAGKVQYVILQSGG